MGIPTGLIFVRDRAQAKARPNFFNAARRRAPPAGNRMTSVSAARSGSDDRVRSVADTDHNEGLTPQKSWKAVATMGGTGLEFGVLGPLLMSVDGTPVELGAR